MELKIKLADGAKVPTYGSAGAACFDLYSMTDGLLHVGEPAFVFPTGVSVEVPEGYALMVYSRSGQGFGQNVRLANCVGIIDSDYRGFVSVKLTLDGDRPVLVRAGDRIAQAMLVPVPQVTFIQVDKLSDTARGAGGFGSTGR